MTDEILQIRTSIVDYLRHELLGPRGGEREMLHEEPHKRYIIGTLYPRNSTIENDLEEDEDEISGAAGGVESDNQADDPVVLANQYLPASMGLSFYLRGDPRIQVKVTAASYQEVEEATEDVLTRRQKKRAWRRTPVVASGSETLFEPLSKGALYRLERDVFDSTARLHVIWRQSTHGWLVTVSLINNRTTRPGTSPEVKDCLYQVEVRCKAVGVGHIAAYPRTRLATDDREEHVLDLLYRYQVAYGVGHGCSVDWVQPVEGSTSEIWTEMIPTHEVLPISYDFPGYERALTLSFLADQRHMEAPDELVHELDHFVAGYHTWIEDLIDRHSDIPDDLEEARITLLRRLRGAHARISAGVRLLENDTTVRRAFCLANQAMLIQMAHSRPEYAGTRRPAGERAYSEPDISLVKDRAWRPFQLAFQLLTLASVAFPDDPHRDTVDLIWFPTGGGKTEAYLAVTAFLIFYRRMIHGPVAGGMAVLMRYTLRLLTSQQFRRAATLILACEWLRQMHPLELGNHDISIGLWVGQDTTPNSYQNARQLYETLLGEEEPKSPFQIDRCPWCGTEIVPAHHSDNRTLYGIQATHSSFRLFCPNTTCPFHDNLPIGVVDEQLYDSPPTLLLGTVDKFARIPWEARAGELFGGSGRRPPELIIQDELHLISGPLGTIVGAYEIAVDAMASWEGTPPKIIASTATIRRADEQCFSLYARNVELFPPSGLDASDSYFARYDRSRPGRLYVGVLGPSHTASTTMIRTSAALLQTPVELRLEGEARDAYWTLVAYHNSLRELGKSRTFAADDIPARIQVIAHDQKYLRDMSHDRVQELTSNIDAAQLSEILSSLERRTTQDEEEIGDKAIGLLLCTNMLSVGVDVQRLGAMLVNGQPKSTTEYIQATSRVGRGNVPGLVVCVYSPSKPRDRSHYERFVAYHEALYRQVEPTSVTPFSQPARDRALHAALVALVRHKAGLSRREDAGRFSMTLPDVKRIAALLNERVELIDPREAEETAAQILRLLKQWDTWAAENPRLEYSVSSGVAKDALLYNIGDSRRIGWPTLQSMRNVDRSCLVKILGASK